MQARTMLLHCLCISYRAYTATAMSMHCLQCVHYQPSVQQLQWLSITFNAYTTCALQCVHYLYCLHYQCSGIHDEVSHFHIKPAESIADLNKVEATWVEIMSASQIFHCCFDIEPGMNFKLCIHARKHLTFVQQRYWNLYNRCYCIDCLLLRFSTTTLP